MLSETLDRSYAANHVVESGPIRLDELNHAASIAGHPIPLSATEFRVLECLMLNEGEMVCWSQLSSHVWGGDAAGMNATLKLAARRLQKKLSNGSLRISPDQGVVLSAC